MDLTAQDKDGRTILHYAVIQGNKDILKLLMCNGADPKIQDKRSRTALDYAHKQGDTELAELQKI